MRLHSGNEASSRPDSWASSALWRLWSQRAISISPLSHSPLTAPRPLPGQPLRQLDPGSGFITSLVTVTTNSRLLSLLFFFFFFRCFALVCCAYRFLYCLWQVPRESGGFQGKKTSPPFFLSFMSNADFPFLTHHTPPPSSPLPSSPPSLPPAPLLSLGPLFAPAVVCTKTDFQSVNHHVLPADGRISFAEHRGPISRVIPRV